MTKTPTSRSGPSCVLGSELGFGGCGGRSDGEPVRLVDQVDRDFAQLGVVLAGVVGTEEELQAGSELNTEVGLGTAAVATVGRAKGGGTRGNCSSHIGLISHLGCLVNERPGILIPRMPGGA